MKQLSLYRKLSILKTAAEFLYSDKGPDYGEFGGCGDTAKRFSL